LKNTKPGWRCSKCKEDRYWFVDIEKFNRKESDMSKRIKVCECGAKLLASNHFAHKRTIGHKNFLLQKEGKPLIEKNWWTGRCEFHGGYRGNQCQTCYDFDL
jgi:hypothetical protein